MLEQVTNLTKKKYGTLEITLVDGSQRQVPILKSITTIGRSSSNTLPLSDEVASRYHARLTVVEGRALVEDLGSSNGTFIRGERIPPQVPTPLGRRRTFQIGTTDIRFIPFRTEESKKRKRLLAAAGLAALLLLLGLSWGTYAAVSRLQKRAKTQAFVCEQPTMLVLSKGGQTQPPDASASQDQVTPDAQVDITPQTSPDEPIQGQETTEPQEGEATEDPAAPPPTPEPTSPPSRPILSLAFLDLPFPYDGGNENFSGTLDQFKRASQRSGTGGRINSFFDHYLPLYPASNDPAIPGGEEPAETPIAKHVLIYTGENSVYDNYSGHPALDYSTFEHRRPTTPLFAAADGVITSVGEHTSSGALFVKIKHTVPNVGDYQTVYWHLHPDEYFDAMLGREGEYITAGTRVGTMGNTGWSTGHHLHFEVRFDRNADGFFSNRETVDPYGWIPSVDFPEDPWYDRTKLASHFLFIHSLGVVAQVNDDGSGLVSTDADIGGVSAVVGPTTDTTLCAKPGALPPGGTVNFSWAPDPLPGRTTAGTGHACTLSVLDNAGTPVSEFDAPLQIAIPFEEADLENVDPSTLTIYWLEPGSEKWDPLPTNLDFENQIASAFTSKPGQCALLGTATKDIAAPSTQIEFSGATSEGGSWYEEVTVTLTSDDPSGIDIIEYSLDAGTTWLTYNGPFTVQPSGIPLPISHMDEEFFGGGPGRFLVLASSTDGVGNIEDPPAFRSLVIDPSQAPGSDMVIPETSTTTPSPTATPSPTPTLTPTPSPTTFVCENIMLTVVQNAFCRSGPGTVYDVVTGYVPATELEVVGQNFNDAIKWWQVLLPNSSARCWISDSLVDIPQVASCVDKIADPPTPTPMPTPTRTPTITPTPTPTRPKKPSPTPTNTPIIIL